MNYIAHLNNFLQRSQADARLRPHHISLYIALFDRWNRSRFASLFTINRERLLVASHIGSKDTLLKCLRELHQAGYICYQPPLNKFAAAKVSLPSLKPVNDCAALPQLFDDGAITAAGDDVLETAPGDITGPKTGTDTDPILGPVEAKMAAHTDPVLGPAEAKNTADTDPVLGHLLKHINKENFGETAAPLKKFKDDPFKNAAIKTATAPALENVNSYFAQRSYPTMEARKFFLHYESTGWMTGGHTPVTNWHAAADKWMLNDRSLYKTHTHANRLQPAASIDTSMPKNYAIPF